jgi:hypothetical protein
LICVPCEVWPGVRRAGVPTLSPALTPAIDTHVQTEQAKRGDDEDGQTGVLVPAG